MELDFIKPSSSLFLAILPLLPPERTALFTSISTQFTTEAFPILSPFQTIFVGLLLIQVPNTQNIGVHTDTDTLQLLEGMVLVLNNSKIKARHKTDTNQADTKIK
jgi:hypothetical protein